MTTDKAMTDEEIKAERVRNLARAVYGSLYDAQHRERYIRTMVGRHGEDPVFKQYMREMGLEHDLEDFMGRPPLRA